MSSHERLQIFGVNVMQQPEENKQQHPSTTHIPLTHRPLVVAARQLPNCKGPADPATFILVREKVSTRLGSTEINLIHNQIGPAWSRVYNGYTYYV